MTGVQTCALPIFVKNNGYGPAHNLVIKSAQPKILENLSNVPVSFALTGSSATPSEGSLQNGVLNINFGDIPAGGIAEGYWLLSTTKDGYFVEFTSTLAHQDYLGVQLDPLIESTNTHLIPAVGGEVFYPPFFSGGLKVTLLQNGTVKGDDFINLYGNYFISDLDPGRYAWQVEDSDGVILHSTEIDVLSGQPTPFFNYNKPEQVEYSYFTTKSKVAKNLVIVTHGWHSRSDAWPNQVVSEICSKIGLKAISDTESPDTMSCHNDEWEVKSVDWRGRAALPRLPNVAYVNAAAIGEEIGRAHV